MSDAMYQGHEAAEQARLKREARPAEVEQLRVLMGTAPSAHPPEVTEFWRGVEGIEVRLVPGSHPRNPYRMIYELTTMTWGSTRQGMPYHGLVPVRADGSVNVDAMRVTGGLDPGWRWEKTAPRYRAMVVEAVLTGKTLPNSLEGVVFAFATDRISRWAFDQIARARLGVAFMSMGTRDNRHDDVGFRFHESTWRDPVKLAEAKAAALKSKESYLAILNSGRGSWQEAREVLPISSLHRFGMVANFPAIKGLCAQRMKACEAEDVVAWASLVRREVETVFPYLASFLRPGCDFSKRCDYHEAYSLSETFSALFRGCGRWPAPDYTLGPDVQRNESCADYAVVAEQTGYALPDPKAPTGVAKKGEGGGRLVGYCIGQGALSHPLDRAHLYEDWNGADDPDAPFPGAFWMERAGGAPDKRAPDYRP